MPPRELGRIERPVDRPRADAGGPDRVALAHEQVLVLEQAVSFVTLPVSARAEDPGLVPVRVDVELQDALQRAIEDRHPLDQEQPAVEEGPEVPGRVGVLAGRFPEDPAAVVDRAPVQEPQGTDRGERLPGANDQAGALGVRGRAGEGSESEQRAARIGVRIGGLLGRAGSQGAGPAPRGRRVVLRSLSAPGRERHTSGASHRTGRREERTDGA